jgi:hypothetical protein
MESQNTRDSCHRCANLLPEGLPAFIDEGQIICRDCNDAILKTCPNCAAAMKRKLPATRGKCPACGDPFFICREQRLYSTGILNRAQKASTERLRWEFQKYEWRGLTVRDRDAAAAQARMEGADVDRVFELLDERVAENASKSVPGCFGVLTPAGVTNVLSVVEFLASRRLLPFEAPSVEEALRVAIELTPTPGQPPSESEIVRSLITNRIAKTAGARPHLYRFLAQALSHYDEDSLEATRSAFREEARECAELGFDSAEVMPAPYGCDAAQRIAKRRFRFEQFLTNPPVPCADCSGPSLDDGLRPFCQCWVRFYFAAAED